MTPADALAGQQLLAAVRAAGQGGASHKTGCIMFAGWAMRHAEELVGLAATAAGIPVAELEPQCMVTPAAPREGIAAELEKMYG